MKTPSGALQRRDMIVAGFLPLGLLVAAFGTAAVGPIACAERSSDAVPAPQVALPHNISPPTAAEREPIGIKLPRGRCDTGFFLNSSNRCVPLDWHCAPIYYDAGGGDGCDCNCGAYDPDCADPNAAKWCYKLGRSIRVQSCQACD